MPLESPSVLNRYADNDGERAQEIANYRRIKEIEERNKNRIKAEARRRNKNTILNNEAEDDEKKQKKQANGK